MLAVIVLIGGMLACVPPLLVPVLSVMWATRNNPVVVWSCGCSASVSPYSLWSQAAHVGALGDPSRVDRFPGLPAYLQVLRLGSPGGSDWGLRVCFLLDQSPSVEICLEAQASFFR